MRRRRRCNACDKRFTTYERAKSSCPRWSEERLAHRFGPGQTPASLELALRKRPVTTESVDAAVADIEEKLLSSGGTRSHLQRSANW